MMQNHSVICFICIPVYYLVGYTYNIQLTNSLVSPGKLIFASSTFRPLFLSFNIFFLPIFSFFSTRFLQGTVSGLHESQVPAIRIGAARATFG